MMAMRSSPPPAAAYPGDPDVVAEAAFSVVGRSIEAALRAARPAAGIPAMEDGR